MKNKQPKRTIVTYLKNGTTYSHPWNEILSRQQVEQRVVMELRVNRSDILEIDYQ